MILNIRGTSGSGKSTVVREVASQLGEPELILGARERLEAYRYTGPNGPLYIIGSYKNQCGGCDALNGPLGGAKGSVARADELVRQFASEGADVLFEGLMISSVYGRWLALSKDFPGQFYWLMLDTPLEVCHDRVLQRNGGKPIKMENLLGKWEGARNHSRKALEERETVIWLEHQRATEQVLELLRTRKISGDSNKLPSESTAPPPPSESIQVSGALSLF